MRVSGIASMRHAVEGGDRVRQGADAEMEGGRVQDRRQGCGDGEQGEHIVGEIVQEQDAAVAVAVGDPHASLAQGSAVHGVEDQLRPQMLAVAAHGSKPQSGGGMHEAARQGVEGDLGAVVGVDRVQQRLRLVHKRGR